MSVPSTCVSVGARMVWLDDSHAARARTAFVPTVMVNHEPPDGCPTKWWHASGLEAHRTIMPSSPMRLVS